MRNGNVWELDIHKELQKYVDETDSVLYPDSRYYRKNKQKFKLDDGSRTHVPNSDKNANPFS